VFKHEWSPLRDVTLAACVLFRGQRRPATDDGRSLVRVVAVGATDLAFRHWMMIRELETAGHLPVTIKTSLGRPSRVDNGAARAAGLVVRAAGTVTGFAAHIQRVGPFGFEAHVGCGVEVAVDFLMTLGASLRSNEGCSRNGGRGHYRSLALCRAAGNQGSRDANSAAN